MSFREKLYPARDAAEPHLVLHTDRERNIRVLGNFQVEGRGILQQVGIPSRYALNWVAGGRGKPGINADILSATEATRMVTDPYFEILGTNGSSDDVTYNAEGGIKFDTDGADGDELILLPHLDVNQSPWAQITWGTDQQTRWECYIKTGASIDNYIVWAGLKLTDTEVIATDANQVLFRYEDVGATGIGNWRAISSIANVDDDQDTGVAAAINTIMHFAIEIDSDRVARFYIDDVLVKTTAALTDAVDLIPYIGVAADGAAEAKALVIFGQAISREVA